MGKLIAISPVGKNGQTVVPAAIRKMFNIDADHNLVGFYIEDDHVELAPVAVVREKADYSDAELKKVERLGKALGGKKFTDGKTAKSYLKSL
ncbi:MAG: hypothetical protein A2V88_12425 [Elusimicrobia bacterium RBG_16_66_12]|nr:MAG: hypothetical protein A2V88_12425 [Elusimicrobia bacterium RBG_16_66_12]